MREGPFPITIPADAAAGKYQIWAGLYSERSGERIELDAAERRHAASEFRVGEFDVVAAGTEVEPKPAIFDWLPVDEVKVVCAGQFAAPLGDKQLITSPWRSTRRCFVRQADKDAMGRLTLTAFLLGRLSAHP